MTTSGPILSLVGLTRRFGEIAAVDDIDLEILDGEFFTIVGPSGSGKSTLIRILAGLERVDSGAVLLRGRAITDVPANKRPTAMVFQSLALFNHKTVGENIEFAPKMRGVDPAARRARALELMDLVRLPEAYYARPVTRCSGGERQRVALARALASDPEILFFDEPLSAIDYRLRKMLEVELKDLHRETGKTFIYITHSLEEAMVMSDRIGIMRAGRLVQIGPPLEIYQQPRSRFVAEFMGEVNVLRASEFGVAGEGWLVVRPEQLRPLAPGEAADVVFEARIVNDYLLGSRKQFHARADERMLIGEIAVAAASVPGPGEPVRLGFDLGDAVRVAE
ncbi:MAG: ABC transporter ATP-binding protein [Geminicoccaceae bacterium]|nr:ABC transporter ATP-binding protein [Geminicoccaceae bacterium]MCB9969252.1 ABC transporter ATP-binding protein [Geminicoccaceae bacterium]HRY24082.1 ABC transporter ATP-binding protein [Geminicoccaceae bacterium]